MSQRKDAMREEGSERCKSEGFKLLLLALKLEEGGHEPKCSSQRSWKGLEVYRQQGNGDLGPTTTRN